MIEAKYIARFWSKVDKNGPTQPHMDSPCWLWTAGKSSTGYGNLRVGGKLIKTHRVSWIINRGQIPHDGSYHGICVLHCCDNPACVNPGHLFLGTNTDNIHDMTAKGRHFSITKPECVARGDNHGSRIHPERLARGDNNGSRLHPERLARGEAVGTSKLTSAIVIDIRALYAGGKTQKQIAKQFGLNQTTISKIVTRKQWTHI